MDRVQPLWTLERHDQKFEHVFAEGSTRKFLVVVDRDTIDATATGAKDAGLLAGLLSSDGVQSYGYSDAGVPDQVESMDTPFWDAVPVNWIQVTPDTAPDMMRSHDLLWSDGNIAHNGSLGGDAVPAIALSIAQARGEEPVFEPTEDALLVAAANKIGADLLVTNRQGLPGLRSTFASGLTIMDTPNSIPLLGLFLRTRHIYLRAKSTSFTLTSNKTLFFEQSAQLFLPNQLEVLDRSRLFSGAGPAAGLAAAAFRRTARGLERRDHIWRLINQPQDFDLAEDILAALDAFLTTLMGALDATARLVHVVYEVPGPLHRTAWQRQDWLKEVKRMAPTIWEAVQADASHTAALTVLRLLRNTIHAEGLESVILRGSDKSTEARVLISAADSSAITEAAKIIAPLTTWGFSVLDGTSYAVDPGRFIETLLPALFRFLSDVHGALVVSLRDRTGEPDPRPVSHLKLDAVAASHAALLGLTRTR
jgi:hypothetical protein